MVHDHPNSSKTKIIGLKQAVLSKSLECDHLDASTYAVTGGHQKFIDLAMSDKWGIPQNSNLIGKTMKEI